MAVIVHHEHSSHADNPEEAIPKYRSHKVVCAVKIGSVDLEGHPDGAWCVIIPHADEDPSIQEIHVEGEWLDRYKPAGGDKGYWVKYEDGYESWSPSAAFENGYSRISS